MKDATDYACDGIPAQRGAEWVHHYLRSGGRSLEAGAAPESAAVNAYVNHGRWVVGCPDCNNAQLACRTDPRFLCNECGNVVAGRLWRPVVWPADVAVLEAALGSRPLSNQNWAPPQTVADIEAENLMEGRWA